MLRLDEGNRLPAVEGEGDGLKRGDGASRGVLAWLRWLGELRPYGDPDSPQLASLDRCRQGLILIALVYPPWALLAREGDWDPIEGRLLVSGVALAALAWSFKPGSWAQQRPGHLLSFTAWVVAAQYYVLVWGNDLAPLYVYAAPVLVILLSSLQLSSLLVPFLIYNVTLTIVVAALAAPNPAAVEFGLITATCCALSYLLVGGFLRLVRELGRARRELESRVVERTNELSEANASLTQQLGFSRALNQMSREVVAQEDPVRIIESLEEIVHATLPTDLALLVGVNRGDPDEPLTLYLTGSQLDDGLEVLNQLPLQVFPKTLSRLAEGPTFIESHTHNPARIFIEERSAIYVHEELGVRSLLAFSFGHRPEGFEVGVFAGRERGWSPLAADFLRSAVRQVQIALQKIQLQREWERSQAALGESEAKLHQAQKMEAVGRLAGGIAHDFNNLLTAIRGYASLVHDGLEPGDRLRADVREIQDASARAAGVVDQLLNFSRQEVRSTSVVDMNDCVAQLENMLGHLIGEGIAIECEPSPEPALVEIDASQAELLLLNLAVNARDAMPAGGRLRLRTAVLRKPGHPPRVLVEVSDTGEGMSPLIQQQIFEPFFTTKEVGKGTGLGLSLVYSAVKQAGGDIQVTSREGEGSAFRIELPQAAGEQTSLEALADAGARDAGVDRFDAPPREDLTDAADRGGDEVILLVEDEASVRRLAARVLRGSGYRVMEAGSGEELAELHDNFIAGIDLLITDVVMPGMSGPEVAQALERRSPGVPVLFISGYADTDFREGAEVPEGAVFLAKPFSSPALRRQVRELLEAASDAKRRGISG